VKTVAKTRRPIRHRTSDSKKTLENKGQIAVSTNNILTIKNGTTQADKESITGKKFSRISCRHAPKVGPQQRQTAMVTTKFWEILRYFNFFAKIPTCSHCKSTIIPFATLLNA